MAKVTIPIYKEEGRTYYADSYDPLVEAAKRKDIILSALGRGNYPGTPIPGNLLPGLRSLGFWDATHEQDWGLLWHRNEGVELAWLETGTMDYLLGNKKYRLQPGDMTM